jgi:hypothetical protein
MGNIQYKNVNICVGGYRLKEPVAVSAGAGWVGGGLHTAGMTHFKVIDMSKLIAAFRNYYFCVKKGSRKQAKEKGVKERKEDGWV